jgi:hypothetical protein
VLQDQFGSSIHTALIIKPDNFWQKQRTNLGSQKYKFEVSKRKFENSANFKAEVLDSRVVDPD